jgi:hypothetical protein
MENSTAGLWPPSDERIGTVLLSKVAPEKRDVMYANGAGSKNPESAAPDGGEEWIACAGSRQFLSEILGYKDPRLSDDHFQYVGVIVVSHGWLIGGTIGER